MTTLFDLRSILLVGACTTALGAITFMALGRLYRPAHAAMSRYALALAMMAFGQALLALRHVVPDWWSYVAANVFISAGVVLTADATRRLFGHAQPAWSTPVLIAGVAAFWISLGVESGSLTQRILVTSAVHGLGAAVAAHAVRRSPDHGRQPYVRTLATFFIGYAVVHLMRGVAMAFDLPAGHGLFEPHPGQTAFGLVFVLSPIGLAMIVQMMLHARISGELHRRATTDELTGLHSRGHFFELSRELLRQRTGPGLVHHLLMIDLDHFKSVNDRFGHSVGDRALRHAAHVLRVALRNTGVLGRYGGEEFCALIGSPSACHADRTIDQLRRALENAPLHAGRITIRLTASIGVVPVRDADSLERVLVHADHCVYRAKTEGRNRVVRFGEILAEPVV